MALVILALAAIATLVTKVQTAPSVRTPAVPSLAAVWEAAEKTSAMHPATSACAVMVSLVIGVKCLTTSALFPILYLWAPITQLFHRLIAVEASVLRLLKCPIRTRAHVTPVGKEKPRTH
jgi:hypothetical protein